MRHDAVPRLRAQTAPHVPCGILPGVDATGLGEALIVHPGRYARAFQIRLMPRKDPFFWRVRGEPQGSFEPPRPSRIRMIPDRLSPELYASEQSRMPTHANQVGHPMSNTVTQTDSQPSSPPASAVAFAKVRAGLTAGEALGEAGPRVFELAC